MFVRALFDDGYVDVDCNSFDECPLVTRFGCDVKEVKTEEEYDSKFHSREFYLGGKPHPQIRKIRAMDALGCRDLRKELLQLQPIKELESEDINFLKYLFRVHHLPLNAYLCCGEHFTEQEVEEFWQGYQVDWRVLPPHPSHFESLKYKPMLLLKMMATTFVNPREAPSIWKREFRDECKRIYYSTERSLLTLLAINLLLFYEDAYGFGFLVEKNSRTNRSDRDVIIRSSMQEIYVTLLFNCDWSIVKKLNFGE